MNALALFIIAMVFSQLALVAMVIILAVQVKRNRRTGENLMDIMEEGTVFAHGIRMAGTPDISNQHTVH